MISLSLLVDVDYSGRIMSNNPSCEIRCGMVSGTRVSLKRVAGVGFACRYCLTVNRVIRVIQGLKRGCRARGVSWRVVACCGVYRWRRRVRGEHGVFRPGAAVKDYELLGGEGSGMWKRGGADSIGVTVSKAI